MAARPAGSGAMRAARAATQREPRRRRPGGGGIRRAVSSARRSRRRAGAGGHVETRRRGGFLRESWAELNKVDWPNRAQVIQGTVVVIIAVAIVGAYLWGADQVLRPFVRDVLLGQ